MGKKFFLMLVFFGIQLSVFLLGCSSQNEAEKTAEKTTVVQGKFDSVN